MSRLETLNQKIATRFPQKDYYCEMPTKIEGKFSDWPCGAAEVSQLVDCHACPLDHKEKHKAMLELLCRESAQLNRD